MTIHACMGCAHATWDRNKTGALHPSGNGRCGWQFVPPPIAASRHWSTYRGAPKPSGGQINRREPITFCPTRKPE